MDVERVVPRPRALASESRSEGSGRRRRGLARRSAIVPKDGPEGSGHVTARPAARVRSPLLGQTLRLMGAPHDVAMATVMVDDTSTDDRPARVAGMPGIRLVGHSEPIEQGMAPNHGAGVAPSLGLASRHDDDLRAPTGIRTQRQGAPLSSF